jgi:Ni,Fe-hydrogenase III large subunit
VAHDLTAFVVPDARLARAAGLDPADAGLALAATPRHATVLLLVGPIPDGLVTAAAVAYAQIPRPRAILALGVSTVPGLPEPDAVADLGQDALRVGVAALRERLTEGAFSPEAPAHEIAVAATRTEYVCPMHPEIVRDEAGTCPLCGMDLVPRETAGAMARPGHDHAVMSGHDAPAAHIGGDHPAAFTCPMHPEVVADSPGRCPICGMRLEPVPPAHDGPESERQPTAGADHGAHGEMAMAPAGHAGHGPLHSGHAAHAVPAPEHGAMEQPEMERHASGHAAMAHQPPERESPAAHDGHAAMGPGADHAGAGPEEAVYDLTDHAGHGGGFMSMVAMTRDLPRSEDGLPMEWSDVPFGPLFPGLPGGLALAMTLDGDGVAGAAVDTEAVARGLDAGWPGPAETFPQRLERLDPLAPVAYRLLARSALEAVAGVAADALLARARVRDAEWERIGSHLGWLAAFGFLLGDQWLASRAAALQLAAARAETEISGKLVGEIREFVARVPRVPLLGRRLAGIGETTIADHGLMLGPVARAAGIETDARLGDGAYAAFGFAPVIRHGGDALARLLVRLGEIGVSLDLVLAAGGDRAEIPEETLPGDLSGDAAAAVETPRGAARLRLVVEQGTVVTVHLDPPSAGHIALVPGIVTGEEVADALVTVASLDLSPWEVAP